MKLFIIFINIILLLTFCNYAVGQSLYEGSTCKMKDNRVGICVRLTKCSSIFNGILSKQIKFQDLVRCSFIGEEEIICCPQQQNMPTKTTRSFEKPPPNPGAIIFEDDYDDEEDRIAIDKKQPTTSSSITKPNVTQKPTPTIPPNARKSEIACLQYSNVSSRLTFHIIGGTETNIGDFPHMAALGYPADEILVKILWKCGGSLISERFLLTAAHCTHEGKQPTVVRLGVVELYSTADGVPDDVEISEIINHPQYVRSRVYNDIALIKLKRDVTTDIGPSIPLVVTGWGSVNKETRKRSDTLLKATLKPISVPVCQRTFMTYGIKIAYEMGIVNSQMCAFDYDLKIDTCEGESGSPLQIVNEDNPSVIVGVTSFSIGCVSGLPGIYSRVGYYLDWIESIVWYFKNSFNNRT